MRPIGVRNPLPKLFHQETVIQNKADLREALEPQQLAMSPAGAAKLVHTVRLMMELNPEMTAVKIDVKNAFNQVHRNAIITALEDDPSLQHMAWSAACQLAPEHGLESGGKLWGVSGVGATQGDPASSPYFCVSWHKWVRELDTTLAQAGGLCRFGMDDGYCVAPSNVLFPALKRFSDAIKEHCGLELEMTKSEVLCWSGELPGEAGQDMARAGRNVEGSWEPGFLVYGVPVGTDKYVEDMLMTKVDEIEKLAIKVCDVLAGEVQTLWTLLRMSIMQQFDYWLQLVHPSQVKKSAARLNKVVRMVLEKILGAAIPEEGEGLNYTCPLQAEVRGLKGNSFQTLLATLPIKCGGFGLRDQVQLSPAAYVAGLEQAIPFFGVEKGVCPPLKHLGGDTVSTAER